LRNWLTVNCGALFVSPALVAHCAMIYRAKARSERLPREPKRKKANHRSISTFNRRSHSISAHKYGRHSQSEDLSSACAPIVHHSSHSRLAFNLERMFVSCFALPCDCRLRPIATQYVLIIV
jgi:hypothetical protein